MAREKVLIIDDDEVGLAVTEAWLSSCDFDVATHPRAIGSVQAIVEFAPEILLVDVNMPFLSGKQLTKIIRGKFKDMGVIFHSSNKKEELDQLAKEMGALGGIHKDGNKTAFLAQFEQFAKNRRAR